MENNSTDQTVWIADFTINEPLHETAASISAAFTRLSINFPENPSAKAWDEHALIWHRYYTNINKISFSTHEEGELEIRRIGKINKDVLETEQNLLTKYN
jgi:hypothetical protein